MYNGQGGLDRVLVERFFSQVRNGYFVECGSFDGVTESTCKHFEDDLGWTGLNIEPVPHVFERLCANRPRCVNVNVALGESAATAPFAHAIHPSHGEWFGNGSLRHSAEHLRDLAQQGCTFRTFDVVVRPFEDVWEELGSPAIDLFVLDVEGGEVQALPSVLRARPRVLCVEDSIADAGALRALVDREGYRAHGRHMHNCFYVRDI